MPPIAYNPAAWPFSHISFLAGLERPAAQAIIKHIDRGCVSGMSYCIQTERVYCKEKPRLMHFIQIDGWEYSIRNESIETPILSFSYLDGGTQSGAMDKCIQNIRVLNKTMVRGYRVPEKTMRIAAYLMRQIAQGHVPDATRVLSSYKLLPTHPRLPGFFHDSFSYANGLLKD